MLILALVSLLVGVILLIAGLRGRVAGDDPHCRKCGFNLRGRDPSSTRCPECGTVLTDSAIRTGQRRRRSAMLAIGVILLVVGVAGGGWTGWKFAQSYDWTPWKRTAWLVDDLDSADPILPGRARAELIRRVQSKDFSQPKVDTLLDQSLQRQGDRSKSWNPMFADVIETALAQKRVDGPRVERYLKQGIDAKLEFKPKIRRGQPLSINLSLRSDRYGPAMRLRGSWTGTPILLDGVTILQSWAELTENDLTGGGGYGTSLAGDVWNAGSLPDGTHTLRTSLKYKASVTEPSAAASGPFTFEVPLSLPVELLPAGATVDEFKVDETQRDAVTRAISIARVTHDENGHVDVRVEAGPGAPMPVSAEVFLTQGTQRQTVGNVRIDAGAQRWVSVYSRQEPKFNGVVDVHLHPAQDAADATRALARYWGEEIVIKNVTVDAPYDPPFNRDESLRPQIEKSLRKPKLTRGRAGEPRFRLNVNLSAQSPPVKLAYNILLRANGREVKLTRWDVNPSTGGVGYSTSGPDVDPAGKVTSCDVIFRPDPDWEIHSFDLIPPWGGEVVFRDVQINSSR